MTNTNEQAYTLEKAGFTGYLTADKIVSMSLTYNSSGEDRDGDGCHIRYAGTLTPGQSVYTHGCATVYCYQNVCGITINEKPYETWDDGTSPGGFDGYWVTVTGYNSTYGQTIAYTASGLAHWHSFAWYPSNCQSYFIIPDTYSWR